MAVKVILLRLHTHTSSATYLSIMRTVVNYERDKHLGSLGLNLVYKLIGHLIFSYFI